MILWLFFSNRKFLNLGKIRFFGLGNKRIVRDLIFRVFVEIEIGCLFKVCLVYRASINTLSISNSSEFLCLALRLASFDNTTIHQDMRIWQEIWPELAHNIERENDDKLLFSSLLENANWVDAMLCFSYLNHLLYGYDYFRWVSLLC